MNVPKHARFTSALLAALILPAPAAHPQGAAPQKASAAQPALAQLTPQPPTGLFGTWRTPAGDSVATEPCPSGLCLRVVALSPNAPGNRDENNPDAALRNRPICKLEIGSGFTPEGDHAAGGHIYDPMSGKTYKATLKLTNPDTLDLRGYIGISAFGRTETWRRTQLTNPCS